MQIKITRSGPRQYVQVVQSYRDEVTGKSKQQYIASLGRLEELKTKDVTALVDGLLKLSGRMTLKDLEQGISSDNTEFDPALELGDVWAIMRIWKELGLSQAVARNARRTRHKIPLESLVRVMVTNRLSDPMSKLGILSWLDHVCLPGIDKEQVTHQNLLRALDFLLEQKESLEEALAATLLPLFDTEMDIVFYDITTIQVHGESEVEDEVRKLGRPKDGNGLERQFAVGLVQTAEGFPVYHDVFEGNIGESTTVKEVVERLCDRFPIRRLVFVADRGMISLANLEEMEAIELPDGRKVEYILAIPARTYRKMTKDLGQLHEQLLSESRQTGEDTLAEMDLEHRRLIIGHSTKIAKQARHQRAKRLARVLRLARKLTARLNDQDSGKAVRGRPLTDDGAKTKLHEMLAKYRLTRFIKIDFGAPAFMWSWDLDEFKRELQLDGKLVLISNVLKANMATKDLFDRYKDLADIERGFRVLKSQIEIAPVHHRLQDRIRSHTLVCFLALAIQRVMRFRLRKHNSPLSPEAALYQLKRIQRHSITLATGKCLIGVSRVEPEQRLLFEALEVPVPTRLKVTRETKGEKN